MSKPIYFSLLFLFLSGVFDCQAQDANKKPKRIDTQIDSRITNYIESIIPGERTPGIAVAVVQDGQVTYANGFGMADVEHNIPITTNTVFGLASVSKQFTALAIALLIESKDLSLDGDIHLYLPEVPDFKRPILVRHLLFHTSGIRDWSSSLTLAGIKNENVFTKKTINRFIQSQRDLNFDPGTEYAYSNTNYFILAELLEKLNKAEFSDILDQKIFSPLGMRDTGVRNFHGQLIANIATGHSVNDTELVRVNDGSDTHGDSQIYSTVADLAKWVINFQTQGVYSDTIFDLVNSQGHLDTGGLISYGFGNQVESYKGHRAITHGGSCCGYNTQIIRFPRANLGIVVLTNFRLFDANDIAFKIADLYLADSDIQYSEIEESPLTKAVKLTRDELKTFEGVYWNDIGAYSRTILLKDGDLFYRRTDGSENILQSIGNNQFKMLGVKPNIRLKINNENDQSTLVLTVDDNKPIRFSRIVPANYTQKSFTKYQGSFYSSELDTLYHVKTKGEKLVAAHSILGEIPLNPTIKEGIFIGNLEYRLKIEFTQDVNGTANGLLMSYDRDRDIVFKRIDLD